MRGNRRNARRRSSNVESSNENTNNERTNEANARRQRSTRRVTQAVRRRRVPNPIPATNNQRRIIERNTDTRFITFTYFKSTLFRLAGKFAQDIGKQPYTLVLLPIGGGGARPNSGFMNRSPAWVYWLIQDIIPKPAQIVYKPDTNVIQFTNILILDDGSYSGMQLRHTIKWVDDRVYAKHAEPTYHILVPFIKNVKAKRDDLIKLLQTPEALRMYSKEALTNGKERFVFEHKVADQVSLGEFSKFYQNLLQTRPPYKLDRAQPSPQMIRRAFRTRSPITFLELRTKRPIDLDHVDAVISNEIMETYPTIKTTELRAAFREVAYMSHRQFYKEHDRQRLANLRLAVDQGDWAWAHKIGLSLGSDEAWRILRPIFEKHIGIRKTELLHTLQRMHTFRE